jgi:hypothetical protein
MLEFHVWVQWWNQTDKMKLVQSSLWSYIHKAVVNLVAQNLISNILSLDYLYLSIFAHILIGKKHHIFMHSHNSLRFLMLSDNEASDIITFSPWKKLIMPVILRNWIALIILRNKPLVNYIISKLQPASMKPKNPWLVLSTWICLKNVFRIFNGT